MVAQLVPFRALTETFTPWRVTKAACTSALPNAALHTIQGAVDGCVRSIPVAIVIAAGKPAIDFSVTDVIVSSSACGNGVPLGAEFTPAVPNPYSSVTRYGLEITCTTVFDPTAWPNAMNVIG